MRIRTLLSLALAVLISGLAPDTFAQQLLYIHADHLNTPRLVTNGSGTPVWRWDQTEPFGDSPPDEDPDGNSTLGHMPLRFPGQYFDKETNLAYNYYRDYDAGLGRYVESDPIGIAAGLNTYNYAVSNPLSLIDQHGLLAQNVQPPPADNAASKACPRISIPCRVLATWDRGPDACTSGCVPIKNRVFVLYDCFPYIRQHGGGCHCGSTPGIRG